MRLAFLSLLVALLGSAGASPSSPPPASPPAPLVPETGSGSGEVATTGPEVWIPVLVLGTVVATGTLGCTAKLMRQ